MDEFACWFPHCAKFDIAAEPHGTSKKPAEFKLRLKVHLFQL